MSKLAKNSEKNHGIGSSLRVSELAKAQGLVKYPGLQGPNAAEGRNPLWLVIANYTACWLLYVVTLF